MKRMHAVVAGALFALGMSCAVGAAAAALDGRVVQQVIAQSTATYPGACPCPYNVTRNGSLCGRRSAYSRPGGYSPKCYARDVSAEDVAAWKARHNR